MKIFSLISLWLLTALVSMSQVKVTGELTWLGEKLERVQVNVVDVDSGGQYSLVLSGSKYKLKLEPGRVYRIEFVKSGYYSKFVTIDTKGIPEGRKPHMYVDMSMLGTESNVDTAVFIRPMGIARFSSEKNDMAWDIAYSRSRFKEVQEAMKNPGRKMIQPETTEPQENKMVKADRIIYEPARIPMQIAQPMEGKLTGYSLGKSIPSAQFKGLIYLGMVLADMTLVEASVSGVKADKQTDNLQAALKAADISMEIGSYKGEWRAEDRNQETVYNILGSVYGDVMDSCETRNQHYAAEYMAAGAWLEVVWRAVLSYKSNPTKELNTFIGGQGQLLQDILNGFDVYREQFSDKELAFLADLETVVKFYDSIKFRSERLQDDDGYDYEFLHHTQEELIKLIEKVRSNVLR